MRRLVIPEERRPGKCWTGLAGGLRRQGGDVVDVGMMSWAGGLSSWGTSTSELELEYEVRRGTEVSDSKSGQLYLFLK